MKNIFRIDKKGKVNFTSITNDILQSNTMTPSEIGLLSRLLSLPENFNINKTTIYKQFNVGRDSLLNTWKSLNKMGHIFTLIYKDSKNKFHYRYLVFEIPQKEKLSTGNQYTDNEIPDDWKPVYGELKTRLLGTSYWEPVSLIKKENKEQEKNDDPEPTGEEVVFEIGMKNTGPEGKPVDEISNENKNKSNILFPPSVDYGEKNEGPDIRMKINIPKSIIQIDDENKTSSTGKNIETSIEMKNTETEQNIPTFKKITSPPDFLINGITYNEKTYYPLTLETFHGQRTITEQNNAIKISHELIKIITKKVNAEKKVCMKNKEYIINLGFLSEHKQELSKLNFDGFLKYLNEIVITKEQKNQIIPNARIIRKYINEVQYYEQAKKDLGYKL